MLYVASCTVYYLYSSGVGTYVYYVPFLVDRDTFYVVRFYYGTLLVVESIVSNLIGMRVVVVYAAIVGTYSAPIRRCNKYLFSNRLG